MIRTYKSTILPAFIILILAGSVSAQENSDAVYLNVVKEYTLKPDGSWDYHYAHSLKLLTYYAFHTLYGEDFIVYNPTYQTLKINKSVTTMADGKKVAGPDNAFNEVLPGFAANAPAFNRLREMVVTHTGLEKGCIIDFDYTLTSSKDYSSGMNGNETLWLNSPVDNFTFIIRIPSGARLNYAQFNIEQKPVVVKNASGTTYTWKMQNLPAALREDFRSKELPDRARILFSTSRNLSMIVQNFIAQPAFKLECNPLLSEIVNSLVKEKQSIYSKITALQDMVVNEINYHPVPLPNAAFRVRTASEVYSSNCGTEIEKAVLLASLLKSAGFHSEPVAILPERYYDPKSSNLVQAERYLVRVNLTADDPIYLSPIQADQSDQAYTLMGKRIISLSAGDEGVVLKNKNLLSTSEITMNLTLDKEMLLSGSAQATYSGRMNPFLKLVQDSTHSLKMLSGIFEGKEIKENNPERIDREKSVIGFQISAPGKVAEKNGHYFLKLSGLNAGIEGWHMNELLSTRVETLEIPFPVKEEYHYTITLPEGYELITGEYIQKNSKSFGEQRIEISQEGRTLQIERMISIKSQTISKVDYNEFRTFINAWNNKKYRDLILRIGPK